MRIYLDNCCYNRPYDDQSQVAISLEAQAKLHIQELIRKNEIELVSSWFITYENSKNPHDLRRKAIEEFLQDNVSIFVSSYYKPEVEKLINPIMNSGIKHMDACHIACAILTKCNCILTTDKRMLKYHSDLIEVLNPTELVLRMEETENANSN